MVRGQIKSNRDWSPLDVNKQLPFHMAVHCKFPLSQLGELDTWLSPIDQFVLLRDVSYF